MVDNIQVYALGSPNGIKIPIALEEIGFKYDIHTVDILKGDQFSEEFIKINPNGKIPAIVDPTGPDGKSISIMESGAILLYLAEKSGQLLPQDAAKRCEAIQWLFFQAANIGPMFGAFGHFQTYGKAHCDHPYPVARFEKETMRLLQIVNNKLQGQDYLIDNKYSIVDISIFPWVMWLDMFYKASEQLQLASFENITTWISRCNKRPATKKGFEVYNFTDIGK